MFGATGECCMWSGRPIHCQHVAATSGAVCDGKRLNQANNHAQLTLMSSFVTKETNELPRGAVTSQQKGPEFEPEPADCSSSMWRVCRGSDFSPKAQRLDDQENLKSPRDWNVSLFLQWGTFVLRQLGNMWEKKRAGQVQCLESNPGCCSYIRCFLITKETQCQSVFWQGCTRPLTLLMGCTGWPGVERFNGWNRTVLINIYHNSLCLKELYMQIWVYLWFRVGFILLSEFSYTVVFLLVLK